MTENIAPLPLRQRAVQAALGKIPFDRLLINANVIDMVTGEIREADIGITGNMIASVHPRGKFSQTENVDDLTGHYLSPGLIDTHVHIESSHLSPEKYAGIVVAQGTTTVFWDPHELANVLGVAGVKYAVESSRNLPLRVICAAPSSVPSTPGLEMSGADFKGQEMQTMLSWPEVAGVAEVMDMHGVINGSERMLEILEAGINSGKLIEGHARGLKDEQLQAYLAAGVTSDHELTSAEDALEKLRAGLTLQIRGSHPYLLPDIAAALQALPHLSSQITLCTDDVPPDHLLEKGGLIALIKLLISYGLRAEDVLRMATFNAAIRMQRADLGLIAAGRTADIIAFDSLENLHPHAVYVAGNCVAREGKLLFTPAAASGVTPLRDTMRLSALSADDFCLKIAGLTNGKARLRNIKGARFTQWSEVTVEVKDGVVQLPEGFSMIWVQHRHGRHDATPQMALLEGWGELRGAIATSYSHDSHNLVVLGRSPADMVVAANQLISSGGGMALSQNGTLLAKVDMPIAGMLSELPAEQLAEQFKNLRELSAQIADWEPPYRVFKAIEGTCLACNAGPHLTDLGLTDGGLREIVDPVLEIWPDKI
ncbi:adenine deaminase [Rahnella bonaserana]|jgi:adenine deaminase|uniref:adenine deaminase n=1 Tax=Rahnella bonaserana TaxID=2816248 RepID=UPI0024C3D23E|nr:adenine deaminase C-terminal domain-containing protein [Rahnella bonaserana]WHZ39743.1 adenine deaminase C-terminal domain-containing protein [Rahnella bonaserana]